MTPSFAMQFAEAWSAPTPERLTALLDENVVLLQPHAAPIRGKAAAHREFRRLLAWVPGLHGVVTRSSENGEIVFIEWVMRLPVGATVIEIPAVDRFRVRNGLGVERVVYFDQARMAAAVLRRPVLWAGFLRYRLGR